MHWHGRPQALEECSCGGFLPPQMHLHSTPCYICRNHASAEHILVQVEFSADVITITSSIFQQEMERDFTLTDLPASDYKQVLQKYFGCNFHQRLLLYLLALTLT